MVVNNANASSQVVHLFPAAAAPHPPPAAVPATYNISRSTSFCAAVNFSGNCISKATSRSPLRVVSLGKGRP